MSSSNPKRRTETRTYAIGYGLALMLTGVAFAAVYWHPLAAMKILGLVLTLALAQMIVHFHFFLHIGLNKSAREDLQLILFSTLIIILMASGTLVLLFNLRARMM